MAANDEVGNVRAVNAAAATTPADTAITTKPTPTTTTNAPSPPITTTTTKPTTTASLPPATSSTPAPVTSSSIHSTSIVSSIISSVHPTTSIPITSSLSLLPSTSISYTTASSVEPSITPLAAGDTSSSSNNNHSNLIGPIVGAVGGAALLLGVGVLFFRRQRHKREENDADRTFSDYLASSDAAMRSPGKPQWATDQDYTRRNSAVMRSPASIAAGLYQQPSPRMMPAIGAMGAAGATQQMWNTSGSQSPDNTLVGGTDQLAPYPTGYNRYSGNYNSQYYSQPEYPAGQGYYQYQPEPYQYNAGYEPYFDPETEQYVYPPTMSSGQEQALPSNNLTQSQPPNSYEPQQYQMSEQTDYRQSPLPPLPQPNTQSMISSTDEPRFPVNSPTLQNPQSGGGNNYAAAGGAPTSTHKPDLSTAGQEP